jgi:hypothetical protein
MDNIGVYIDFDNIWASILDNVPTLLKYDIDEDNKKYITTEFEYTIGKIIDSIKSNNANIKFIKAFSDFDQLLFIQDINVIDILHTKGIQTYMPYVRNNKDMSDRALIISTIKDIAIDKRNINKMLLLTGDIDYLPLFEFLSESTTVEFEILSFKNRFNQGYNEVFYLKDKIKFIDTIIGRNSLELEDNKKLRMFQKYLENNNIDVKKERVDIKKTIRELNNEYYCRFEHYRIKKFISKLKNA